MKKLMMYFVVCLATIGLQAQSVQQQAGIKTIRTAYQKAQADAAKHKDLTLSVEWKNFGFTQQIEFFYDVCSDGDAEHEYSYCRPYLARVTTKRSGKTENYEEILYNRSEENGVLFYYGRQMRGDNSFGEQRTYFTQPEVYTTTQLKDKAGKVLSKDSEVAGLIMDEGFVSRLASEMKTTFNSITNRNWD